MISIQLPATEQQAQLIQKYINDNNINFSVLLLDRLMELIEDIEDTKIAIYESENLDLSQCKSFEQVCMENGIDYETL